MFSSKHVCVSSLLSDLTLRAPCSRWALFFLVFDLLIVIWSQAGWEGSLFSRSLYSCRQARAARALLNGDLCLRMSVFFKLIAAPRESCVMQSSWRLLQGTADSAKVCHSIPVTLKWTDLLRDFLSYVWSLQTGGCTLLLFIPFNNPERAFLRIAQLLFYLLDDVL